MYSTRRSASKNSSQLRQRLLSTKKLDDYNPRSHLNTKYMKLRSTPYMNTRSVTRKLCNVGATYRPPTIEDETEWKEWPVHGMHERPVYHPQFGLITEYLGRLFTSLNGEAYEEILPEQEIQIISVNPNVKIFNNLETPRKTFKRNAEESQECFEHCMHTTLHTVLSYCSEVTSPAYKDLTKEGRKQRKDSDEAGKTTIGIENKENPGLQHSEEKIGNNRVPTKSDFAFCNLEDNYSISDETLMEMSSFYKNLIPNDEVAAPSVKSTKVVANFTENLSDKSQIKEENCCETYSQSQDTSDVARILSEYNKSVAKVTNFPLVRDSNMLGAKLKNKSDRKREEPVVGLNKSTSLRQKWKSFFAVPQSKFRRNEATPSSDIRNKNDENAFQRNEKMVLDLRNFQDTKWLESLIENTGILYCAATGVHQDDLADYINTPDCSRTMEWLRE